jgi:putative oxidoreductase
VVCLLETVGAVLLVLGLGTRILALGVVVDMLVAIGLVKLKMMKAKFMDPKVQGWEFEAALLAQALALVFLGAGSVALDPLLGL